MARPLTALCLAFTATAAAAALGACSPSHLSLLEPGSEPDASQAASRCPAPLSADSDGDGIENGPEGCAMLRDSDGDGRPDYLDLDSDNDGIADAIERGPRDAQGRCARDFARSSVWPCDTDGDGYPDYTDVDSDGDKLDDRFEDLDGDGQLGCCVTRCGALAGKQAAHCALGPDGCGPGQRCVAGLCTPGAALTCAAGESSPLHADSFSGGAFDSLPPAAVCRDASVDNPRGRPAVKVHTSASGDFKLALQPDVRYREVGAVTDGAAGEGAAVLAREVGSAALAGFVVSRLSAASGARAVADELRSALVAHLAVAAGAVARVRAPGALGRSHDGHDVVRGVELSVELSRALPLSRLRDELLAAALGRRRGDVGALPATFGPQATRFVVRLSALRRAPDAGQPSGRALGVVAVALAEQASSDPVTRWARDWTDGTALASARHTLARACELVTVAAAPAVDLVWVVDGSPSMAWRRLQLAAGVGAMLDYAAGLGLDLRVGVTGSSGSNDLAGRLCSRATGASDDGVDRFLSPAERTRIVDCIANPPGASGSAGHTLLNARRVVQTHLPMVAGDARRLRPAAAIALLAVSDAVPSSLRSTLSGRDRRTCALDAPLRSSVDDQVRGTVDLLSGGAATSLAASFHALAGGCASSCGVESGHGLREVADARDGGVHDICAIDDAATLRLVVDEVAAAASPIALSHEPVAPSLAVSLAGRALQRRARVGFHYRPASRRVGLRDIKLAAGDVAVVAYSRWQLSR